MMNRHRLAVVLSVPVVIAIAAIGPRGVMAAASKGSAASASARKAATPLPSSSGWEYVAWPADPPSIRTEDQWLLTFRHDKKKVSLISARKVHLAQPRMTPRQMGRYAVELFSGTTLVDRLRFDFPLLGADESIGTTPTYSSVPRFETNMVVSYGVMVPDSPHISRARLVDRATRWVTWLPWPPDSPAPVGSADFPDSGAIVQEGPATDGGVVDSAVSVDAGGDSTR